MIRKYDSSDFKRIVIQDEQKRECMEEYIWDSEDTVVFERDNKVLVIMRPYYELGGRIYISCLVSSEVKPYAIYLVKKINKIFTEWLENNETNRVEFITQTDFAQANRLARLLGFTKEGTMRKYYNGIDFNIWGRVSNV